MGFVACAVDYRRGQDAADAAVYDDVDEGIEFPVDDPGVGIFLYHVAGEGGAEDGVLQFFDEGAGDDIIGNAKPDGILTAFQDAGDLFAGGQDKGIGPREIGFQQTVERGGDAFRVVAQIAEVVTDERELGFGGVDVFNAADAFYRFMLKDVAAQAINRIGGVYDDSAVEQAFDDRFYISWLRIYRMQLQ